MKNLLLLFISILIYYTGNSQDNTFFRKYNLSGMNGGLALKPTSDGGFVAAGQHEGNGSAGGCDIYVYRVDECGNKLWFKLIGGPDTDGAKSIKQLANGDFLLSGHYDGSRGFLSKLSSDGNLLWLKTYPTLEWIFDAYETSNGDIIAVGKQSNTSCVLIRTESNGNVLWAKSFNNFGQMPLFVEEINNGEIVFLSTYNIPQKDMALAKTDPNGNIIWSKGYGFGYSDYDHTSWSCSAAIDHVNNTIVLTTPSQNQAGQNGDNIFVLKANLNDGSEIWSKSFGGPGSDQSRAIALTPHGYAICGNSDSYPVTTNINPDLSASMLERNILLLNLDFDGNIIWSRQYGAEGRDKGIGVGYGSDGSYTMAAYTSSSYFGNTDGSMDPLFIKTDSLGFVNCQTADCPLSSADILSNVSTIGTSISISVNTLTESPTLSNYAPIDNYQCQDCYTQPFFELSDSIVCVGQQFQLYNLTTIGLKCFQQWQINGISFDGNIDTIVYSFNTPGLYHVTLSSTCGETENAFNLPIRVSSVMAGANVESNYNGYGVSCKNANDGEIVISASGGYFPSNSNWEYLWTPNTISGANPNNLYAGIYTCIIVDEIGCSDTIQISISEPLSLVDSSFISSNYNGYAISCFGNNDGSLQSSPNFPNGGVPPYSFNLNYSNGLATSSSTGYFNNLSSGDYTLETIDVNGCASTEEFYLDQPDSLILSPIVFPDTCQFGLGAIQLYASGGANPFNEQSQYTFSINNNSLINNSLIDSLTFGNYNITVEDINNCISSDMVTVSVMTSPYLSGNTSDTISCKKQTIVLNEWVDYNFEPSFVYTWTNQDGAILDSGNDYPIISIPGNYFLIGARNDNFCIDTLALIIHLDSSIYFDINNLQIANIVTRNNDGMNECWNLFHSSISQESIENYIDITSILIYNRWGELLIETQHKFTICELIQNLNTGVYYYIVKSQSICGPEQYQTQTGWFNLTD